MYDKINPIFYITDENRSILDKIDILLKDLEIKDYIKSSNLKKKSRVRSIHSSLAIEANSLSLQDVSNVIDNKMVLGKKDEVQEVKNAIELYKNINNYNWRSEKDFLEAHTLLMKYFDDDNGLYRNHGEGVKKDGKIIFTAPESILVPSLMKSLFEYINNEERNLHSLIIAAIFHYYLVYIHPFGDGNGRIARFWVSLILKDYNQNFEYIPLEEEMYLNQKKYYSSISECHNNGNANAFISFFLDTTYNCIKKTTQKTTQKTKLNNNQLRIIELIKENPKITRSELADILNITSDGVKYNLKKLVNNNIIERVGPDNGGYWSIK